MRNKLKLILLLSAGVVFLAGCKSEEAQERALKLAPVSELSAVLQQAPASIQEAYRFALANPEVLKHIPCYCGCVVVGHTSNYDCYVAEENSDGSVIFDNHGFG
jgi:hypothetical protein